MSAVLGIVSKVIGIVGKFLPFLAAYKVGKGKVEKEILENNAEARHAADVAIKEVKQEIRDDGVADYVRNNKI